LLLFLVGAFCCSRLLAQSTSTIGRLTITGDVDKPLSVTLDDLRHMPRTKLKVMNPHAKEEDTYEGVLLTELLDASDGYRVIFSLPELDADFQDSDVIVADTMNGAALDDKTGPFRLVAPHDKRPARWVKMVQSLIVVRIPK
jgi:DMSO/TMAO reductase YedYZ molybdopterin-dependent catalytic subunit